MSRSFVPGSCTCSKTRASTSSPRRPTLPTSCARSHAHKPDVAIIDVQMQPDNTDDGLRAAMEIRAHAAGGRSARALAVRGGALRGRPDRRQRRTRRLPAQGSRDRLQRLRRRRPPPYRQGRLGPRTDGRRPHARPPPAQRSPLEALTPTRARGDRPDGPGALKTRASPRRSSSPARTRSNQTSRASSPSSRGVAGGAEDHRRVLAVLTYLRR